VDCGGKRRDRIDKGVYSSSQGPESWTKESGGQALWLLLRVAYRVLVSCRNALYHSIALLEGCLMIYDSWCVLLLVGFCRVHRFLLFFVVLTVFARFLLRFWELDSANGPPYSPWAGLRSVTRDFVRRVPLVY